MDRIKGAYNIAKKGLSVSASAFNYIFVFVIFLISFLPLVWVLMSSFKTNSEILNSAIGLPSKISFSGYSAALKLSPLYNYYGNSILIAVTSTILNVFFIGLAAYALARFEFKLKNPILLLLSVSLLLPMTALLNPIYMVVSKLGLYNSKAGLILVYTALGLPTSLYILRSYFLSIPKDIEEASYIDGSGFLRTFTNIVLPIAIPGMATAAVLQFLMCWNEFMFALVLTNSKSSRTLPLALSYFTSQFSFNYTAMFAAIVMVIIPSILVYIILQDQVVGSLAAGAVKG